MMIVVDVIEVMGLMVEMVEDQRLVWSIQL
jgi:hypothetical protein